MLRFFHINGFENPVALEASNPNATMFELTPSLELIPAPLQKVLAGIQEAAAERVNIFVINISNVTFAIHGTQLPHLTIHALEPDQKWAPCEIGGAPQADWPWLKIGAKAALFAWIASQQKHDVFMDVEAKTGLN
jgi:hypothetical protein